jgi:hypothetical protein
MRSKRSASTGESVAVTGQFTRDPKTIRALAIHGDGQREFSWGEAFCRLDSKHNKDWLVVVYTVGPQVPLYRAELLRHLREHEPVPNSRNA